MSDLDSIVLTSLPPSRAALYSVILLITLDLFLFIVHLTSNERSPSDTNQFLPQLELSPRTQFNSHPHSSKLSFNSSGLKGSVLQNSSLFLRLITNTTSQGYQTSAWPGYKSTKCVHPNSIHSSGSTIF